MLYNYKLFEKIMQQKLFSFITHTTEELLELLINKYKSKNEIIYNKTNYTNLDDAFKIEYKKFKNDVNNIKGLLQADMHQTWFEIGEDTQKGFFCFYFSEKNDGFNTASDLIKNKMSEILELNDISEITEEIFYENIDETINKIYEENTDIIYDSDYISDYIKTDDNLLDLMVNYFEKEKIDVIAILSYNEETHFSDLESFIFENRYEEYVTIHRKIYLPDDPEHLEKELEKFGGIGIFWSYEKNAANVYWESGDFKNRYYITFEASVNINNINWKRTIYKSLYGLSSEKEIEVYDNTTVILKAIYLNTKEELLKSKLDKFIEDYYNNNPMATRSYRFNIEDSDIPEKSRLEFNSQLNINV